VAKKRYALLKVYDLETDSTMDKIHIKGLDVVRSSFPPAFATFMKARLNDILHGVGKEEIDDHLMKFVNETLPNFSPEMIARNTSVKNITGYDDPKITDILKHMNKTPMHVKAAITYNRLLKKWGLDKTYEPMRDGDKIKYVYLKTNPIGLDVLAFKGYNDPREITQYINDYIDADQLFDAELKHKIQDFYTAMGWGTLPTDMNQHAATFFSF
jgi:DNA polymerase elongation subunit (family B)